MSKIQITELQASQSELNVLDAHQTDTVVGGYWEGFDFSNVVQINNNINVQIAFGGDNYNWSNLNNNAGTTQS
ncbi:MAG: hypothetical protein ACRDBG_20390 [Waterburya sp.]